MTRGDPRSTSRWQRIRLAILAAATHCAECRRTLDTGFRGRHPLAPSVDHVIPLSEGGDPYDPGNLRAVHYGCNTSRHNRRKAQQSPRRDNGHDRYEGSRQWW